MSAPLRMTTRAAGAHRSAPGGFTLVELMVAMTISLLLLAALVSIFLNTSRSQSEMVKMNGLIENGRIAIQIMQDDLVHSGFWAGYLPGFDDLTSTLAPDDAPTTIPNPCQLYPTWDSVYRFSLLGVPVQSADVLPAGPGCLAPALLRVGTDVLVVRHVDTCVPGVGNCEADMVGRLYFQSSFCAAERNAGTVQAAASNSVTLAPTASAVDNAYTGVTIRIASGLGAGQHRAISAYDGATRVATLSTPWTVIPDNTTQYAFDYALGTNSFPLHQRDCVGTGTPTTLPITAGSIAEKRRYISNIYYITDVPHPERVGEVIPTLVRSRFDLSAGTLAQQAPEALIDGVEAFRVELGIDEVSDSGDAVDYTAAIDWADASKTSPTNRGDGAPDQFVRCTTAAPCSAAQLSNVVAVKLYVLARTRDRTPGYTDSKSYCLGEPAADGSCPAASTIAAANDNYKRHVFTTSVRLTNISGRRETP
jgi:prepilin-type N-terminal cleavage/methylation domain-containing protein